MKQGGGGMMIGAFLKQHYQCSLKFQSEKIALKHD